MLNVDTLGESLPEKDIVFDCVICGKSLMINALGAGLAITCPDCGAEQQVPLPEDMEDPDPAVESNSAAAATGESAAERELPEISEMLVAAREQINVLTQENDELQFRRKYLEKRHAIVSQSLQALRREIITIRKALDRTEAVLKTMEEPPASDTQPMG